MNDSTTLSSPRAIIDRVHRLQSKREMLLEDRAKQIAERDLVVARLSIADRVTSALEKLTEQLFADVVQVIESQLTVALQEVLEQPLRLKVIRGSAAGRATISFHIERDGQAEDILRGQGGSVANVLSVGLRLLALTTLPEKEHRRFLVLDEQDCWLRPDLVPRLVKIVNAAGKALGFQVLMISHHDSSVFAGYASRTIKLTPTAEGVRAEMLDLDQ
ncbi:MAG: DNA repair protein [Phycisphaerae bacterium]|nr:DNA repair protein [Phycisphaerae bacterium]